MALVLELALDGPAEEKVQSLEETVGSAMFPPSQCRAELLQIADGMLSGKEELSDERLRLPLCEEVSFVRQGDDC